MEYKSERNNRKRGEYIRNALILLVILMLALIAWVLYTKEDQKPCVVNVVNQVNQGCSLCEAATAKDKKLPSFVKKRKGKKHVCPNTTEPTQQQTQEKQVNTVPEPGTVVLMGIGSVGLLVTLRHS